VEIMENIMKNKIVAVLVLGQVLYKLRSVSADSFYSLEHVHLSMLNDLFNACICCTIDSRSSYSILTDNNNWTIVRPLSPPFHHVHQLNQGVGGCGHLVALGPAHQLCERHNLLMDFKDPRPNVGIMIV